jgi:hypothetical protein
MNKSINERAVVRITCVIIINEFFWQSGLFIHTLAVQNKISARMSEGVEVSFLACKHVDSGTDVPFGSRHF